MTKRSENKESRTRRREQRRQDRAIKNGDFAAMQQERKSVYDEALVLCPSCSTQCYKAKGYGLRFDCPRCKESRSMPDIEFSQDSFIALYLGGVLYCWRALDTGNFPGLNYGEIEHNEKSRIPNATYNGDIDTNHAAHFRGFKREIDMLAQHLSITKLKRLIDGKPVPVYALNWAVEWSV